MYLLVYIVVQRPEASDAEQMRGVLPPTAAAHSLSSSSTEASTSRQSSLSPGVSAPVNGQWFAFYWLLLLLFLIKILFFSMLFIRFVPSQYLSLSVFNVLVKLLAMFAVYMSHISLSILHLLIVHNSAWFPSTTIWQHVVFIYSLSWDI